MKLTMEILKECIDGTFEIDKDGFINADGHIDLSGKDLSSFGDIKFGVVTGNFWCQGNNLTSLEGSPKEVGGGFFCSDNKLNSL